MQSSRSRRLVRTAEVRLNTSPQLMTLALPTLQTVFRFLCRPTVNSIDSVLCPHTAADWRRSPGSLRPSWLETVEMTDLGLLNLGLATCAQYRAASRRPVATARRGAYVDDKLLKEKEEALDGK